MRLGFVTLLLSIGPDDVREVVDDGVVSLLGAWKEPEVSKLEVGLLREVAKVRLEECPSELDEWQPTGVFFLILPSGLNISLWVAELF